MKKKLFIISLSLSLLIPGIVSAIVPNDPNVQQHSLENINAYQAWDLATGSHNVVVAIIDNGFDTFHPELIKNVWKNESEIPNNKIDDDKNGYIDDVYGWNFLDNNNNPRPVAENLTEKEKINGSVHHATVVAGIIGASGNNGQGTAGINWDVRLMNLKVLGNSGEGNIANFFDAVRYAVENGADIINISLVSNFDIGVTEAIRYAYDNGVTVIAAAGNERVQLNLSPQFPVCADKNFNEQFVLGVSAIKKTRQIADFSNIGSDCIDITAPGVDIGGPVRFSPSNGLKDKFIQGWDGTSFAAPLVAGTAALIKSVQPLWGPKQIFNAILSNTHKTEGQDEAVYANLFGKGLLQVDKAVEYAINQPGSFVSNQTENFIIGIDNKNSRLIIENLKEKKQSIIEQKIIKESDDINIIRKNSKNEYIVSFKVSENSSEITHYNDNWEKITSWQVPIDGKLTIVSGNVYGDAEVEVIVGSTTGDEDLFHIYDLTGKLIKRYKQESFHSGISIGLAPTNESKNEILISQVVDKKMIVEHFDNEFKIKNTISVPYFGSVGAVEGMNVNGELQYVAAANRGDKPLIGLYDKNGKLIRRYFAVDKTYLGGLSIAITDFNGDGKDNIVVSKKSENSEITVYNSSGKRITKWTPTKDHSGLKLLSI